MTSASLTDWLTAIGTVGAVVVALGTPTAFWAIRRSRRARLAPRLENRDPFFSIEVLPLPAGSPALTSVRNEARLGVENVGEREARDLRAQLIGVWDRQLNAPNWKCQLSAPIPFSWSSSSSGNANVVAHRMDLVDMLEWSRSDRVTVKSRPSKSLPCQDGQEFVVGLAVVGPDVDPLEVFVAFNVGPTGPYNFRLALRQPAPTEPGSFYGMSRQLSDALNQLPDDPTNVVSSTAPPASKSSEEAGGVKTILSKAYASTFGRIRHR